MTSQVTDSSVLGLQRELELLSHKIAWSWLHKPRRAMVRPGRDRLAGWVEVDETYLGGVHPGRPGRQAETKALIGIAGQVVAPGPSLLAFMQDNVELSSAFHTDRWVGYNPMRRLSSFCRVASLCSAE